MSPSAHRSCTIRRGTVRYAERTVLHEVDLSVGPEDRVALVGDNGAGKSTLLGVIAGVVPLASGERHVEIPGGVAFAQQHPVFPSDATVAEALDLMLGDVRTLERAIRDLAARVETAGPQEQPELLERYAAALDRFEARDGYRVDQRVDVALEQLGLARVDRRSPVGELSGGERAKLALAAAVSAEAELLLLDEPTNDLDDRAVAWLEERLARHRGGLVVVTHDRAFLDRFATDIVAVEGGGLRRYGDGYRGYLAALATERRRLLEAHDAWLQELARNRDLVEANAFRLDGIPRKQERAVFGHGAFRARTAGHGAMSRIRIAQERLSRLQADPAPRPPDPLRFAPRFRVDHAQPQAADQTPLVLIEGLRRDADAQGPSLCVDELTIEVGDRWLVEGPNGAGKTTLLRMVAGELPYSSGSLGRRPGLRPAWLRQGLTSTSERPLFDAFAAATGLYPDDAREALTSLGLFELADLERPLSVLSVGQRRRFEVAVAVAVPSDVLLLDEPTNHLSPELAEQLEHALEEYAGAVVTVTHDRRWREHAAERRGLKRLLVAPGGTVGQVG